MKTFKQFVNEDGALYESSILDPYWEVYHNPSPHELQGLGNKNPDGLRGLHSQKHGLFIWPARKDGQIHDIVKDHLQNNYDLHFPKGDVHPFYMSNDHSHPFTSAKGISSEEESNQVHSELLSRLKIHPATKRIISKLQ